MADQPLLQLHTDVFQALQTGQRSHRRVLLEILQTGHGPPSPPGDAPFEFPENARTIFLKQFRDAEKPDRAGYQALVLGQIRFERREPQMLPAERLEVRLHRYPSHPIARQLGLTDFPSENEHHHRTERRLSQEPGRVWEGRPVDVIRPLAAFWVTTTLETGYGDKEIRLFPRDSA